MQTLNRRDLRFTEATLVDLPYEDIILTQILPLLSIGDLFSLKSVSCLFNQLISRYFKRLRKLNLTTSRCLTNGQFKFVLSMCENYVEQIDLSYNLSLNNRLLAKYLIAYRLGRLNTVKLNDCHWIDRSVLTILIVAYGDQLRCIECAGCWSLNDRIVSLLAVYCTGLRTLNLSNVYSLTDQSLLQLGYHQSNSLRCLNLKDCWRFTDFTIFWLIKRCAQLVDLKVDQVHLTTINRLVKMSNRIEK